MMIYEISCLISFGISITLFGNIHGRSWDVAVTIGREIDFFSSNATLIRRLKNRDAVSLNTMAYDDVTRTIFLSDNRNNDTSIFFKDLGVKNVTWGTLLSDRNLGHIVGMIWDLTSQSLIYIDSIDQSIRRIQKKSSESSEILKLPYHNLRSLAYDACSRKIYWANSNKSNPSISVCDFNGNNEKIVINSNLYEPLAITIDQSEGKLYWIDDEEGIHYKIERSDALGMKRETLVHGKHQQPVSIAVDLKFVYWIDWVYSAIWRIRKEVRLGEVPVKWKSFSNSNHEYEPTSLVTRENIQSHHCLDRGKARDDEGLLENVSDEEKELMIHTEDDGEVISEVRICLNGGYIVEINGTCSCRNGFEGSYCEKSICHNFCLDGECEITENGRPHCKCSSISRGPRCEENACTRFCLNDGECSIENGEPYCTCKESGGKRCEEKMEFVEICRLICSNDTFQLQEIDTSVCRCPMTDRIENLVRADNDEQWAKTLIMTLSVTIGVLMVLIVILSIVIIKLRQRPRIKKRFIVSKNGITPLTARPQLSRDHCEIMIENCCNMNICETPCFEPRLRRSELGTSKKEHKDPLLSNMDGNNSS